jgi:hypothetical protein
MRPRWWSFDPMVRAFFKHYDLSFWANIFKSLSCEESLRRISGCCLRSDLEGVSVEQKDAIWIGLLNVNQQSLQVRPSAHESFRCNDDFQLCESLLRQRFQVGA